MNDSTKPGCWRMLGANTTGKWIDIVTDIPSGKKYFPVVVGDFETSSKEARLIRCQVSSDSD